MFECPGISSRVVELQDDLQAQAQFHLVKQRRAVGQHL